MTVDDKVALLRAESARQKKGPFDLRKQADREIVITRVFDAPIHAVYEAMAEPSALMQWLSGPPGWAMVGCVNDLRVGGAYHYAWRGPDGIQMSLRGVFREVLPNERITRTESFEMGCNAQMGEQIATVTFTEEGGQTTLRTTVVYLSTEARDQTVASNMERGVATSYERLDCLLAS